MGIAKERSGMSYHAEQEIKPLVFNAVNEQNLKTWSQILHDPNPIHLDKSYIQNTGLGEHRINQGPANVAYLINMLESNFPGGFINELDVRFIQNVFEGDKVEATGTIKHVREDEAGITLLCDLTLTTDTHGTVLTGTGSVLLYR